MYVGIKRKRDGLRENATRQEEVMFTNCLEQVFGVICDRKIGAIVDSGSHTRSINFVFPVLWAPSTATLSSLIRSAAWRQAMMAGGWRRTGGKEIEQESR